MARLQTGAEMPDFVYETPFESNLHFRETVRGRKTVLLFLRYYGCTLCQYDIHLLKEGYGKITEAGGQALAVLQSDPAGVAAQAGVRELPFQIICDPHRKLYKAFEIAPAASKNELGGGDTAKKVRDAKMAGFAHGAYEGDELQLPAVFILDRDGIIRFAHYGKNAADLPSVDELAGLLKKISDAQAF